MAGKDSKIIWPTGLTSFPEMCYESLAPLYVQDKPEFFGQQLGFAVSCSKHFIDPKGCPGCIQKLEVTTATNFAQAKLQITHEVLPDEGACSQILQINDKLRVACFDNGVVIPIKNFGYKKTFNCDVRAGLRHHSDPINCMAADSKGTQLASGSTRGEIGLYQAREEEVTFLSRARLAQGFITGLAYFKPVVDMPFKPHDNGVSEGENLIIYSEQNGHIGLVDARCAFGAQIGHQYLRSTEPRVSLSSLCFLSSLSGPTVAFGTKSGELITIDLRHFKSYLYHQSVSEDDCIRRMKEVVVQDKTGANKTFLALTNNKQEICILETKSMKPNMGWSCDRLPEDKQKDLCQVGDRIVTCGAQTSIGCWVWDSSKAD